MVLHENGILKSDLFLVLVPHLEAQSLLGFAISSCGNDCYSGRNGALLLGGKGAAGADEYLNHTNFMQSSLQNGTLRGKDEIEKPHRLSGMVLKMFPSLPCLSSGRCEIRNQLWCRRNKVYCSLQGDAQIDYFNLIRIPVVGTGFLFSGGGNHHFKVWIRVRLVAWARHHTLLSTEQYRTVLTLFKILKTYSERSKADLDWDNCISRNMIFCNVGVCASPSVPPLSCPGQMEQMALVKCGLELCETEKEELNCFCSSLKVSLPYHDLFS